MKLLLSTYACAPNRGSEHGIGWNWTTEASRLGHQVWALVSPAHRDSIAAACRKDASLAKIHWLFPEIGYWPLQQGREPKWERTYNLLWQRAALKIAASQHREVGFDAVHHLTWGGVRAPTFLGALGIPLIMGPLGGGETSPKSLRDHINLRGRILERLRDLSNATIEINPIVRGGLHAADVIFAKTTDTRDLLSPSLRVKTIVQMELSVSKEEIGSPRLERHGPPKLLFAGRLLYWKGAHIAIETMAALVARMPDARLTIVGNGPERERLKALAAQRNLMSTIDFVPWMPQDEFKRLYLTHDMMLFPSLHDSTGGVVLEALCHGMPVACLDLGGPKDIVTPQSGIVVSTRELDTPQVAARLAEQLHDILSAPTMLAQLSVGAIARANDFLLADQMRKLYDSAWRMIEDRGRTVPQQANSSGDQDGCAHALHNRESPLQRLDPISSDETRER